MLEERLLYLTHRVNDLGNEGAHRRVLLDGRDVQAAIHDSIVVLNEIYKQKSVQRMKAASF